MTVVIHKVSIASAPLRDNLDANRLGLRDDTLAQPLQAQSR